MTRYNVHLYREMRLFFPGIDAESHEAAAEFARQQPTDTAQNIEDCDGNDIAALVDVDGDQEYNHTKLVDFSPNILSILKHAIATEEGNWDDGHLSAD
jgi:hypothetical protein